MHELITTAAIPDSLVEEVLKILQGLCGMTPVRQLERRLIFEGPKAPPLTGIGASQLQSRKQANIPLWRELHDQLVRQSYYITVSYEITEAQFGNLEANGGDLSAGDVPVMNLGELRGTLQFFDNPDPPGTRPVNSRLAIHIEDESHLPAFLEQINYNYFTEHIREAHYAYRDNIIFCLSHDLQRPKHTEGSSVSGMNNGIPSTLPAFEEFQPFDAENKWALTASVEVSDGNQPVLMQRGFDQLAQAKHEFGGILDFGMIPRRQLDTRVPSYNQSIRT